MNQKIQVCTIVLSYNRPRMLLEALGSIHGADHVIVLDDGSDFDVWSVIGPAIDRFPYKEIRQTPKLSVDQRMTLPRLGKAINSAIRSTWCEVITYLCDDDLFSPEWISTVKQFFTACPAEHVLKADWGVFKDGEKPGEQICKLGAELTTGNFAHLRECSTGHDLWWGEDTIGCHDPIIVRKIFERHKSPSIYKAKIMAGWRREHPYNMVNYVDGIRYNAAAPGVLSRERLE